MFLITTASQQFWKKDEKILFLGEWCKLFSQRSVWDKLSYEVLPYHWDDRRKLYQDYLYLDKLYEHTLLQLTERLNQIHGVDHSVRYWRIIIGPWLSYFVQNLYDQYQSILTAAESGKVTNTFIGEYKCGQWLPQDFPEFREWFFVNDDRTDDYNHYLYSQIIEYTHRIPFEIVEAETNSNNIHVEHPNNNKRSFFTPKKLLKNFINLGQKLVPDRFNEIVLVSTYLNIWDLIKLQFSLGQFPYLLPPTLMSPESRIDLDLRANLSLELSNNEFELLLCKLIKEQIPSIYVEGYGEMNRCSLNAYPGRPRVIFTANAYYANEAFKFWAAHHVDCGIKLVGTQHGGHYGTGLWSALDDHEIRIYDQFYTWGWKSDVYENTKPLAAAKLNKVEKSIRPKKDGRILIALAAIPRYSYNMYSAFVASSGMLAYFNDQYRFVRGLSDRNQKLLIVRLYMRDYGWSQQERWACEFPAIECYLGNKSMSDQLNESRLFIGTYNATTYLETFAANFPTVLFWNPDHWELRPSAQPYFDELRRVGILHDTPESAAAKVNEICDNPISWWQQPEIQAAKNKFNHQFARTSGNWLKEWKSELLDLAQSDIGHEIHEKT